MKPLVVVLVVLIACFAAYAFGYRVATQRSSQKPSYLAVSLAGDRVLQAVTTVVQDKEGRYVTQGDEVQFLGNGPETRESTLRPFAFQFRRLDFFSHTKPMSKPTLVPAGERTAEETFIVRDGKIIKVDPIMRVNPIHGKYVE